MRPDWTGEPSHHRPGIDEGAPLKQDPFSVDQIESTCVDELELLVVAEVVDDLDKKGLADRS